MRPRPAGQHSNKMNKNDDLVRGLLQVIKYKEGQEEFLKNFNRLRQIPEPPSETAMTRILFIFNLLTRNKDDKMLTCRLIESLMRTDRKVLLIICAIGFHHIDVENSIDKIDEDTSMNSERYLIASNHLKFIYDLQQHVKQFSASYAP